MKYRKKPVVIEAVQFVELGRTVLHHATLVETNGADIASFMGRITREGTSPNGTPEGAPFIEIETLEGVMRANVGDWIIKGVKGEFYPVKPDIFEATYEPAEDPQDTTTILGGVKYQ
jgi:hypothetical protein